MCTHDVRSDPRGKSNHPVGIQPKRANAQTRKASIPSCLCPLLLALALAGLARPALAQSNMQRLHSFGFASQSAFLPQGQLLIENDGFFYGTTVDGGATNYGAVFKVRPDGSGFAVLHSFAVTAGDGANPYAAVIRGSDGALYGTTYGGGTYGNGTVFKVNTDGTGYGVLYNFSGTGGDGSQPRSPLIQGADGALYGTTGIGPTNLQGTVYKLNTDGSGYSLSRGAISR